MRTDSTDWKNPKSRRWRGEAAMLKLDRRRKPKCCVVRIGATMRIIGCCAAAKWLGISRTTLFGIVEGKRTDFAKETIALVRREYPELF